MRTTTATFLDVELRSRDDEDRFHAWWREARALIQERAKPERLELLVLDRGKYSIFMEFRFPGGFKLMAQDRPWQELEARRPPATATVRDARSFGDRDITTATLQLWLDDRGAGRRDFVLANALSAESFARKRIPGSVSLPVATIGPDTAAAVLGAAHEQPVVLYCAGYT